MTSRASLVQAQDAYDRMKTLYENKSLPEIKWVEVQSKLQQAQSMESIARKNLEDASLYAPFDGVIGKYKYHFDSNIYANRVFDSKGEADSSVEIQFGPNIKDWPKMCELPENLVFACGFGNP